MKKLSGFHALPLQRGGDIIHFDQDGHGRVLVIDEGDRRLLNFDSLFEQSSMRLSHPHQLAHEYTQLMLLVLVFIEPRQITLFGLGGASLLRTLHHLLPDCHFNVVELRQVVVDIAQHYFSLPDDDRVVISVNDVLKEIVHIKSAGSDIIFSDLYDAYRMVAGQLHPDFLTQCSRILSPQGWLVANLNKLPADKMMFFAELRDLFPTVILSTIADNTILFASKAQPLDTSPNLERLEVMESVLQQPFTQLMPRLRPLNFKFE